MTGYPTLRAGVIGVVLSIALPMFGCSEEPSREAVDAPTTPEAQLTALEEALERAEASGDWVRAEVLLEALVELTPDGAERKVRLRRARRNREVTGALDEVAHLLDQGAWRSAEAWIIKLDQLALSDPDRSRLDQLRGLVAEVRALEEDRSLLPPTP